MNYGSGRLQRLKEPLEGAWKGICRRAGKNGTPAFAALVPILIFGLAFPIRGRPAIIWGQLPSDSLSLDMSTIMQII